MSQRSRAWCYCDLHKLEYPCVEECPKCEILLGERDKIIKKRIPSTRYKWKHKGRGKERNRDPI